MHNRGCTAHRDKNHHRRPSHSCTRESGIGLPPRRLYPDRIDAPCRPIRLLRRVGNPVSWHSFGLASSSPTRPRVSALQCARIQITCHRSLCTNHVNGIILRKGASIFAEAGSIRLGEPFEVAAERGDFFARRKPDVKRPPPLPGGMSPTDFSRCKSLAKAQIYTTFAFAKHGLLHVRKYLFPVVEFTQV